MPLFGSKKVSSKESDNASAQQSFQISVQKPTKPARFVTNTTSKSSRASNKTTSMQKPWPKGDQDRIETLMQKSSTVAYVNNVEAYNRFYHKIILPINHLQLVCANDYKRYHKHFLRQHRIYDLAAKHTDKFQVLCFTVPLLVIQGLNAVGAQFLHDPMRREVATILSVIGGIVIALQDKSGLAPIVSAYNHVSNTYSMLASQAKAKFQEAEMYENNEVLHHRDRILEFSEHCVKIENNAKDCPTIPDFIEALVPEEQDGPITVRQRKRQNGMIPEGDNNLSSIDNRIAIFMGGLDMPKDK